MTSECVAAYFSFQELRIVKMFIVAFDRCLIDIVFPAPNSTILCSYNNILLPFCCDRD